MGKYAKSYIGKANIVSRQVGEKGILKRLKYNRRYNSKEVNKCREVKDILGVF